MAEAKKGLAGVDKANKDAYAKALNDARQVLLNHSPQDEPLAGYFNFVKWEKGAFAENKAYADNFFRGILSTVYKNGAYTEAKGSYKYKQGQPDGRQAGRADLRAERDRRDLHPIRHAGCGGAGPQEGRD